MVITIGAAAQSKPNIVSASFSEKGYAEVHVSYQDNGKMKKLAEYRITPDDREFLFVIPADSICSYKFQVNLMKQDGRHLKTYSSVSLPLVLNPSNSYTLKIISSQLNLSKKTGWELKKSSKPSFTMIKGTIKSTMPGIAVPITLQSVKNGRTQAGHSFYTNTDGNTEIAYKVKQDGFYYLSTPRVRTRIYLKSPDNLEINIDNKTGVAELINGSEENQLLFQWQNLIAPITKYGYNMSLFTGDTINMDTYMETYEKLKPSMEDFIKKSSLANNRALLSIQNAMLIDKDLVPINLLFQWSPKKVKGFRPIPKDFTEVPATFQQFVGSNKLNDASILYLGEGARYLSLYAKLSIAMLPGDAKKALSPGERLHRMIQTIANDTLKSYFLEEQMDEISINNLSEFKSTFEPLKNYAKSGTVKDKYISIYNLFIGDTAYIGKSAYNFSLPDSSGRMISLEEFKGKVIFIDVWATWCGPCKAQIPFLKEIEHEYSDNQDIVFMGISLDRQQDRQKWINLINKENLHGVQLLDDMGKSFGKKYDITSIPRFLLVSKEGKWIEIRCPLPEAKENLRKYIDDALKQSAFTTK